MRSKRTRQFREQLRELPIDARRQAYAAYRLFKVDPYHPSLHFKRVNQRGNVYSVRIGLYYRALGLREDETVIVWFWIGTHAEYDIQLSQ